MISPRDRRIAQIDVIDPRPELLSAPPGTLSEVLDAWLEERGEPGYRTRQIADWIYRRGATDWESMTNLPKELRLALARDMRFPSTALDEERRSEDGTRKFLWKLVDGERIESVLIPSTNRDTICISSQAGCALACSFCATGMLGYRRDLTTGEIVDQARRISACRGRDDVGVNVVFMGMGEPLLNWERVAAAIDTMIASDGLDIGARRITVSTVGVPEGIVDLADRFPQVRLAVSLHAARDEVRDRIVPLNKRHPLRQLYAACRIWSRKTGKRMTYEVLHLPGVNDRPEDIAAFRVALKGVRAQINLMRYNPIEGAEYRRPSRSETEAFREAIEAETGVTVTIRKSRGLDIEGACGQLHLARRADVDPTAGPTGRA